MNISIDVDGTATKHPEIFMTLGKAMRQAGHKVYILTGIPLSVFNTRRKEKYPHLADMSWYDAVLTPDLYDEFERYLAGKVIAGDMDNHILVGMFKRRMCKDYNIAVHFDDDIHVKHSDITPVFLV